MKFKKATSWDKPLLDLAKLEKELGSRAQIGGWYVAGSKAKDFTIYYSCPYETEDHEALLEGIMAEDGLGVDEAEEDGVPVGNTRSAIESGFVRFVMDGAFEGNRGVYITAGSEEDAKDFAWSIPNKVGWRGSAEYHPDKHSWQEKSVRVRELGLIERKPMRSNPPKNIDTEETLGGECAVWALAAASGRTVQDVRRAFLDAGIDIWTEDGLAKGTELERMRRMVQKLDLEKRITYIGYSYPTLTARSKRALYYTSRDYTSRFMHGKSADDFARTQAVEDGFQFPPGTMSGANRATVGQVLRKAKRERLAAIVVTGRVRLALRKIEKLASGMKIRHMGIKGVTHVLGYSPSLGVYDTAASIPNAVAMERFKDGNVKLGDWHRHGQEIPDPSRPALLWVYFKGE